MVAALTLVDGSRPAAQQSGSVRGRVEIGVPMASRRPSAAYGARSLPSQPLAPPAELRNVVIYWKDAPPRPTPAVRAEIIQKNEMFIPRVAAVPVGSTVDFPNEDPIYHNVFSLSRARTFNLGRYPRGTSERVRFDRPGIVKVFCDIHSHMSAAVIVFNHSWFVVPDESGRFELPDMPSGERRITAWHERLGDTTFTVRVEPGRPASVDFILPVPQQ